MNCRIVVITIDEPIYTVPLIEVVIKRFRDHIKLVTALSPLKEKNLTPRTSGNPFLVIVTRLKYYGPKNFSKFGAIYIFLKLLDFLHHIGITKRPFSIPSILEKYKIQNMACPHNDINNLEYIKSLRRIDPDIILCNFSQIAGKEFLDIARLGCLNVHYSLLPKNKGREPLFWTLLNDDHPGVTIYKMDKKVDCGNIIAKKKFSLEGVYTLHSAIKRAHEVSARLLIDTLEDIINKGKLEIQSGDNNLESVYNKWPNREDVYRFRRKGFSFI